MSQLVQNTGEEQFKHFGINNEHNTHNTVPSLLGLATYPDPHNVHTFLAEHYRHIESKLPQIWHKLSSESK